MQVLISAQTKGLNTALSQSTSALKGFESAISNTNKVLTSFGVGIGAAAIANIAGQVIEVTAQFEKFGAVLANTLGSSSAAQTALDEIKQFAVEQPFEVAEITAAYVRWANLGLTPTIAKMAKLGDVASSLGAGFEQTAEAFKDLMVGQTKRIEEIGISAQQSNGKIQLSFKGVNLEIEKTAEGVDKALNFFSQLKGVQGTSAAIAETLGGKISNLSDAYTNLLGTVGGANSGVLKDTTDLLISMTNAAAGLVKTLTSTDNVFGGIISTTAEGFFGPAKFLLSLLDNTEEVNKKLEENKIKLQAIQSTADAAFASGNIEAYIKALDQNIFKEEIIAEIRRRQAAEIAAANAARASEVVTLDSLKLKLDELNKQFQSTDANDKASLNNTAQKIIATQAQIEALERLRKKQEQVNQMQTAFGKEVLNKPAQGIGIDGTDLAAKFDTKLTAPNIFPTTIPVPDIAPAMAALEEYYAAVTRGGVVNIKSAEQQVLAQEMIIEAEQRKAEMAIRVGNIIGDSVGDVLSGQKTLVQGFKQATAELLKVLLARALGGIISGAATTGAPPPIAIALATAGVAAISALFKAATGVGKSVGGGGSGGSSLTNVNRLVPVPAQQSIQVEGEFVLHGNDAVAQATSEQNRLRRLGR